MASHRSSFALVASTGAVRAVSLCVVVLALLTPTSIAAQAVFEDEFSDDGPPVGWTVAQGEWSIFDGALQNTPSGAPEPWIWAGDAPIWFGRELVATIDLEFGGTPSLPIGRHGGDGQ